MSKLLWDKWYFDDLDDDCGHLSLAARGAWVWIIGNLRTCDGERTTDLTGWARIIRADPETTVAIITELIKQKICDSNVTCNALSQKYNGDITISCRRLKREAKIRNQNKMRQRRHRDKRLAMSENNESVTPEETETETETDTDNKNTYASSDKKSLEAGEIFTDLPCVGKIKIFHVTKAYIQEMKNLYPGIDIEAETLRAKGWLINNPRKGKTHRGMTRYLGGWYSNEQNRVRGKNNGQYREPPSGSPGSTSKERNQSGEKLYVPKQRNNLPGM